jgi:hypothetical protein
VWIRVVSPTQLGIYNSLGLYLGSACIDFF